MGEIVLQLWWNLGSYALASMRQQGLLLRPHVSCDSHRRHMHFMHALITLRAQIMRLLPIIA